jgi:hypothetical protein
VVFYGPALRPARSPAGLLLFTASVPQLVLALVTVQFFEELGWAVL